MEWVWLHDVSPAAVSALGSYSGIADPRFLDYLGSIALRRHGGAAKPAYRALRHAATVRGF